MVTRLRGFAKGLCAGTLLVACNGILGVGSEYHLVSLKDAGTKGCTSKNDCANGEICLFNACSHTCRKDGDCPAGFRCLNTEGGAACVTSSQAACTGSECPGGTTCSGGQCRSPCVDTNACAIDQVCSTDRVCVGTQPSHDSGSRDAGAPDSGGAASGDAGSGRDRDASSQGDGGAGGTMGAGGTTAGGAPNGGSGGRALGSGGVPDAGTPDAGGTIVTLVTQPFDIQPGGEVYKCQDFANPFGEDVAIIESASTMSGGGQDMYAFDDSTFTSDTNAVADCPLEFHDFVHFSESLVDSYTYPKDVGRPLNAASGLRISAHYLNTGLTPLQGVTTKLTLRVVSPTSVRNLASQIYLSQIGLTVPPGTSTQSRTFTVPFDVALVRAVGQMHIHGVHFSATTNGGQLIYDTTDWSNVTPADFTPPLTITAGSVITWSCSYNNTTGSTLTFGESQAKNESCVLAGVFYPSQQGLHQGQALDSMAL